MKYDYFQDEKLNYEDIEVPDELLFMVRRTIAADRKKKAALRRHRMLKAAASVAAVWFLCLTIGVNSSYAFAEAAVKIPVVKGMAQAVVVRSYRPEIMAVYEENRTSRRAEKEPEEIPEKQAEAVLAEDENNNLATLAGSAGQETPEQMPAETPEGIDAWKAEMTSGKLREVTELYTPELEEKYAGTPEKLRTILLAELPEKDVSLYGYHGNGSITGTALRVKDKHQYFDWKYMDESRKMPEISCKDVNGDGTEEILVFLYNGALPKTETAKEETALPDEENAEKSTAAEAGANTDIISNKTTEASEKKEEPLQEKASEKKEESSQGKIPEKKEEVAQEKPQAEDMADPQDVQDAVSGNNIAEMPETALGNETKESTESKPKPETEPEKQAGEIWVISPAGEIWSANLLSLDDYKKIP